MKATGLKASSKMRRSIEGLTKKYGELNITYGVEPIESNRIGRGFYDYAECYCQILQKNWTINHEGEIY